MFQTTNQNSSWCGYRSKMVKTWSKTDWQKWMGLTTKKDPSLWLHDPSPVGLRSLGLERNWQESTMFSNHEKGLRFIQGCPAVFPFVQVWDTPPTPMSHWKIIPAGFIVHLKKKHRRFAFPGHAPKPDGKHQETSGNTFSYKMSWPSKFAVHLHCPQKQVLPQTIWPGNKRSMKIIISFAT